MLSMNRRALILGSAASTFAFKRSSWAQNTPIRIGFVQTLSGPAALVGKDHVLGAQIAVDTVNKAGGIKGRPVELIIRDDKGTPTEAVTVLRELSSQGVNLFAGTSVSAPTLGVLPILESLNVLWISPGAILLSLTHENYNRHFFRQGPNAYMYFNGAGKLMAKRHPEVKKWGAIVTDLELTHSLWSYFSKSLREANSSVELLEPVTAKFGSTEYRNQIASLMNSSLEGLFVSAIGTDSVTFFQQAHAFGLGKKVKAIVEITLGQDIAKALRQNTPNNTYSIAFWNILGFKDNPTAKLLQDECAKRTGNAAVSGFPAQGHAATMSLINAVEAAGSTDTKAVIEAMENLTFDNSVVGPFRYRKEDHQGLIDPGYVRLGPQTEDPQWRVEGFERVAWRDIIDAPSPGSKFIP